MKPLVFFLHSIETLLSPDMRLLASADSSTACRTDPRSSVRPPSVPSSRMPSPCGLGHCLASVLFSSPFVLFDFVVALRLFRYITPHIRHPAKQNAHTKNAITTRATDMEFTDADACALSASLVAGLVTVAVQFVFVVCNCQPGPLSS